MMKSAIMVLGIATIAVSCSQGVSRVETRSLPRPNPTSYNFPLPMEELRAAAGQAFSIEHQAGQPIFGRSTGAIQLQTILFPEFSTNAVFAGALFRDPANTNDLYLHTFHDPFVTSSIYRGRDGGLPYIATFHLHLTADGSNTLVTVAASDAEVINGKKFGFGSCGPGYAWNCVPVKPTTIEEYLILRYLGGYLGITNMPEVVLPAR